MLIVTSKSPRWGTQKPAQFGPRSVVRSAVFKNAESLGIDPANIVGYWPFWEGTVRPVNIITEHISTGLFLGDSDAEYASGGIYLNEAGSGHGIDTDGYSFLDDTPFWFSFGVKQPTYTTNKALVCGYDTNSSLDYVGIYGGDYLRVRFSGSLLFTNITDFTQDTDLLIRCDGASVGNIDAAQDGIVKQTLPVTNSALKLNHFGFGNTTFAARDTTLYYWLAATGPINDEQIAKLGEAPYSLLQKPPQISYFDFGAASTIPTLSAASFAGQTPSVQLTF